jgi:hypothetical protein
VKIEMLASNDYAVAAAMRNGSFPDSPSFAVV